MRGGALPPAMLCAAFGFALAFAPRRFVLLCLALLAVGAVGLSRVPVAGDWREWVFLGCWVSVILTCASVHLPRGLPSWLALGLAVNAGCWCGAVISVAGEPADLAKALPCVLVFLPGYWLVATKRGIALKVATSWLIAASLLAAVLPIVPTPGYMPDHME
jgi:hypothetical protein